jgi:hypothetical protein
MTDEEKQAFLMFAGTMHGLAKQTDQMLVGQSVNLKPISSDIETQFTKVLQSPTQRNNVFVESPSEQPLVYQQPAPVVGPQEVGLEQAIKELETLQSLSPAPAPYIQPAGSNDIVKFLEQISLNLERIAITLESHASPKRTKITKTT